MRWSDTSVASWVLVSATASLPLACGSRSHDAATSGGDASADASGNGANGANGAKDGGIGPSDGSPGVTDAATADGAACTTGACCGPDCDAGANSDGGDGCPPGGCACGDAGRTCTASQACAGAACTCTPVFDNGLVLRADGSLWQYVYQGTVLAPVQVLESGGSPFVATAFEGSAGDLACAVKSDGSAWCWNAPGTSECDGGACIDDNSAGQLGNGTTAASSVPTRVVVSDGSPLANVREVAVGEDSETACAIDSSAKLWCWGFSSAAGQAALFATPVLASDGTALTNVVQVAVEYNQTCARKTDGTVWCNGFVGFGDAGANAAMLVQVPLPSAAVDIAVTNEAASAIVSDGSVWSWGNDRRRVAEPGARGHDAALGRHSRQGHEHDDVRGEVRPFPLVLGARAICLPSVRAGHERRRGQHVEARRDLLSRSFARHAVVHRYEWSLRFPGSPREPRPLPVRLGRHAANSSNAIALPVGPAAFSNI